MSNKNTALFRGGIAVLSVKLMGAASTFGVFLYIGNVLGTRYTGVYATMFAVTLLLSLVVRLGADGYLLKSAAVHFSDNDRARVLIKLKAIFCFSLPLSIFVAVAISAASKYIAVWLFRDMTLYVHVAIYSASLPFVVAYSLFYILLQSEKRNVEAMALMTMLPQIMVLAFSFPLVYYFGAIGLPVSYLISSIACALIGAALNRETLCVATNSDESIYLTAAGVLNKCKSFFLGALLQQLGLYFETIAISAVAGATAAGVYGASLRVATLVYFVFVSLNGIAAPRLAASFNSGGKKEIELLSFRASVAMTAVGIPLAILLVVFAEIVLGFFGSDFSGGADVLRVLVFCQLIYCLSGPAASMLLMTGNQTIYRNIMIGTVSFQCIFGFYMISYAGASGAAYSLFLVSVFQNIAFLVAIKKKLGVFGGLIPAFRLHVWKK